AQRLVQRPNRNPSVERDHGHEAARTSHDSPTCAQVGQSVCKTAIMGRPRLREVAVSLPLNDKDCDAPWTKAERPRPKGCAGRHGRCKTRSDDLHHAAEARWLAE